MTEPSVCGGEAAFLSNYFDHLLIKVDREGSEEIYKDD